MKLLARLVLVGWIAALAVLPASRAWANCPPNMVELNCQGSPDCEPAGAFCCGVNACAADQVCLQCDGNAICAAPRSSCCGAVACPPGQECTTCGTSTKCRPAGEDCPIGDLD